MVTTKDDSLAEKIRRLRDHGAAMTDLQRHLGTRPYLLADHPDAGYNQRMTDLQASLGSAQMDRADEIVLERQSLASAYDEAFASLKWLRVPCKATEYQHGYQSYPCLFMPEGVDLDAVEEINSMRNNWMDDLQKKGISTRPATHAVHMLIFYKEKYRLSPEDFPNARAADKCSISLPLFHGMKKSEQDFVIEKVLEFKF
ncbi:MAG: aminotransferase DegT, partial [Verrucomicrobia bacterium]|nr:aminotransferase DegT [Verrucomicrobiota bacterium]